MCHAEGRGKLQLLNYLVPPPHLKFLFLPFFPLTTSFLSTVTHALNSQSSPFAFVKAEYIFLCSKPNRLVCRWLFSAGKGWRRW